MNRRRAPSGAARPRSVRGHRVFLGAGAFLLAASPAWAQGDRPNEADLFGAPAAADPKAPTEQAREKPESGTPATPASPTGPASRDDLNLGSREGAARLSDQVAPEDPLKIGGQFYLRAQSSAAQGQRIDKWTVASPSLLDAYFDATPNDRVRGFVLGRMLYDPTLPETAAPPSALGALETSGSSMGTQPLSSLFAQGTRGPRTFLDQFWLRFDVKHRVFVTAGKQHVRWGTARFWTPTDFLHLRRRNPLDVFDARTGTTMLKLHVPIESRAWNLYAYAIPEAPDATRTVGKVSAAARAEIVLGTTELAAGAVVQSGRKPKLALDVSTGLGNIDVYGELALRYGSEIDRVRYEANAMVPPDLGRSPGQSQSDHDLQRLRTFLDATFPVYRSSGVKPQAVAGMTLSHKYADKDVFTIGAEYFYNGLGYDSPRSYPGLTFPRGLAEPATFFYLGRHYGAVFATLPAPYSWDYHTFTLSTLGNLSDQSFITRFDYSLLMLTHLRFEVFAAVHYGRQEGEFRFGVSGLTIDGRRFDRAPALFDLGVALRIAI